MQIYKDDYILNFKSLCLKKKDFGLFSLKMIKILLRELPETANGNDKELSKISAALSANTEARTRRDKRNKNNLFTTSMVNYNGKYSDTKYLEPLFVDLDNS